MHYIGMEALHASAHMQHAPPFVAASIVIAIAASGLALRLAAGSGPTPRFLPAVALGIAISGMHYTAMAGMTIFPHPNPQPLPPALSPDLLAIVVAVVAFVVSGLFLLILVPDHLDRKLSAGTVARVESTADGQAAAEPPSATDQGERVEAPRRPAGNNLPVERDRATYLLPVVDIVAVRANAHYTTIYDGRTTYFCSLPIGDVEGRLADARFVRVHRSHIINMDHVIALRNNGDNCQIELTGPEPYLVPVSRSRTAWVKSQFGLKSAALCPDRTEPIAGKRTPGRFGHLLESAIITPFVQTSRIPCSRAQLRATALDAAPQRPSCSDSSTIQKNAADAGLSSPPQ